MDIKDDILIGALVIIALYLFPFAIAPFVQIGSLIWGFIVGRRRGGVFIDVELPRATTAASPTADDERVQRLVDREFHYLENAREEKTSIIQGKIEEIKDKQSKIKNNHEQYRKSIQEAIPARIFHNAASKMNSETGKNILLFLGVIVLLAVDTLIARQIFVSLGLFVADTIEFLDHKVQYAWIYGAFITATVAILLHLVWPRRKFKSFISENRWSLVIGATVLIVFFVVRLLTVLIPDSAQRFMEVLMLGCWIIGVVGVYWLIGEVVGDESEWFKLLIAMAAPLIVILLLLFGGIVIVHGLLEILFTKTLESWFELRRARAVRQERNTQEATHSMKRGFYRGFTL